MSEIGNQFHSQRGLTLIELLIAIAIGTLLLVMFVQIYFGIRSATELQVAINDIEFNARRAITILSSELKRAGHIGCARLSAEFPLVQNNIINNSNKVLGSDDQIAVKYVDLPGVVLIEMNNDSLIVTNDKEFKANELLMISDCNKGEVFRVKNVSVHGDLQTITPETKLLNVYDDNAEVGRIVSNRYFVRDDGESKSLMVEDIEHRKITLVENVMAINFVYTVNEGAQIKELQASEVQDWSKVVGVFANIKVTTQRPTFEKVWHMYVALPP